MRIVFVGAVEFSRVCLERVLELGGGVVGAVTLEQALLSRVGDGADIALIAESYDIPALRVRNVNAPESIAFIRALRPDVLFVFGWSQLLGRELLGLAPAIGSHPALLPRNRGRHPITWALVDGLTESGLTFLWLDEGADSGDILWQRPFPIGEDDDAADIYRRVEQLARTAVAEFLPALENGTAPRTQQDERQATYRRRRTDEDRRIDWTLPTEQIHNLVRGLARPYVGALTRSGSGDVIVWRARPVREPIEWRTAVPGAVIGLDGGAAVRTGTGWLRLIDVEPADAVTPGIVLGEAR